ncbi:MAG: hypothetical protein V4510_12910 [bacterium]
MSGIQVPGSPGRLRNTFANALSKNKVDYSNPGGASALPALDPASTANYYSQLAGLYAGYQTQLAGLKQQRVGLRADFMATRADVQAQKIGGLADTENASIERGIAGSSADLQGRAGVRAGAEAAIQSAKRTRMEGVAGTRLAAQQAGIQYFMGAQGLEANKLAQQQQLLAQQLQNNLIVSGQETQMDALKAIYQSLINSGVSPRDAKAAVASAGTGHTANYNGMPANNAGQI